MESKDKVISFRVGQSDWKAFETFMKSVNLKPYGVLRMVVETYAAGQRLRELMEAKKLDQPEAVAEMGRIAQWVRDYFNMNGAFTEALRAASRHYNIDLGV